MFRDLTTSIVGQLPMSALFMMSSYSLRIPFSLSLALPPKKRKTEEKSGPGTVFNNCGSVLSRTSLSEKLSSDSSVEDQTFLAKELKLNLVKDYIRLRLSVGSSVASGQVLTKMNFSTMVESAALPKIDLVLFSVVFLDRLILHSHKH